MPPLPSAEGSEETIRPSAAREATPSVMGGDKIGAGGSRVAPLHTLEENIQVCTAHIVLPSAFLRIVFVIILKLGVLDKKKRQKFGVNC